MPKRKAHGQRNEPPSDDAADPMTPEHAVELIYRSFRSNQHWLPSRALAKCLAVPYQRLLVVAAAKDDLSNLVWTSVLVLVYCATHLVDFHESWYEAADASAAWLRQQQHFLDQREDLVRNACSLLNVRYAEQLLTTLFAVTGEGHEEEGAGADDDDAELLSLGWQRCFLDEPPYTAYYWNMETNLSTWRHPLETAQLERELQEQKQQRRDLLARVLPQRLPINRDVMPPADTPIALSRVRQAILLRVVL
ncbi:hypothetical protein BBJ28_00012732 [Nothophytophthora sp. Chile5]|nr:hypothetical protein BBJ28_00012732 [Nothophytophthora sp. Chile5]